MKGFATQDDKLDRIIELLEQIARQGVGHAPSIRDELNTLHLRGHDIYEHYKAKERAMPRRKSRPRGGDP